MSAVSPGHGAGLLPACQPAAQRVHPQQSVPGTVSGPGAWWGCPLGVAGWGQGGCLQPLFPLSPTSVARYLANDMEEDLEDPKSVIFLWALGQDWHHQVSDFLHQRDKLWARMGFRAVVRRQSCEEVRPPRLTSIPGWGKEAGPPTSHLPSILLVQVMAEEPTHWAWTRERHPHHGRAQRSYPKAQIPLPRGPGLSPPHCPLCALPPHHSLCCYRPRPLPVLSKCLSYNAEWHRPSSQAWPWSRGFLIVLPTQLLLEPGTYTLHSE